MVKVRFSVELMASMKASILAPGRVEIQLCLPPHAQALDNRDGPGVVGGGVGQDFREAASPKGVT